MTNQNTPLARAATQASRELVPQLRKKLVGRHFASVNPFIKGDGITAFEYTTISDLSDGFVQWTLPTGNEHKDAITSSLRVVNIPSLYKEFEVPRSDILAWDNRTVSPGEENSLHLLAANTAARKVAEEEDKMIFNGWRTDNGSFAVKGFTQAANNVITGGSIATVGTLYEFISSAISALEEDDVYGENNSYNVALPPAIMAKLRTLRYTNGDRELVQVAELCGDGSIYVTKNLDTTAIVTPVDTEREHLEFLNPVDYRIEFGHPKYDNIGMVEGVAYELFCPSYTRVNGNGRTDAVCKITNLTP
ncbi:MAG TPA: family 1 encapsulin nanocompartment shell protein [Methanocorpusculum sp.]|nr:family 1 encapsulin nanocompartment shell protein [Methanocorpusculum sp.]